MSSKSRQYLTEADLSMLERILSRAGFDELEGVVSREDRLGAARRLIASFQDGMTSETDLLSSLDDEPEEDDAVLRSFGCLIAAKIYSERFQEGKTTLPAKSGYQYGKRIEIDGGWTIYHVFTGIPVQFGAWEMVHMDKAAARRALRILNVPESEKANMHARQLRWI